MISHIKNDIRQAREYAKLTIIISHNRLFRVLRMALVFLETLQKYLPIRNHRNKNR